MSLCVEHMACCLLLVLCALLSIICLLPSCYLIIVLVAPPVSPSLPSLVSLFRLLVFVVLCWSIIFRCVCYVDCVLLVTACYWLLHIIGYCILFEIAQMALSYYLNKLRKDCFLNHHGRTGPENAAWASGAICKKAFRWFKAPNTRRISTGPCYSTRWLFMNGGENMRLLALS